MRYFRERLGYRVLPYIDEFPLAPSPPGRAATEENYREAGKVLERLFGELGFVRHQEKGVWGGSKRIEHLGVLINTEEMRVYVTDRNLAWVRELARRIIALAQRNRR